MLKLRRARAAIPRLRHEQVVEKFVDYHFGRLSPEMNTAIERHVRSCARCKREGLTNAANERKGAVRQLRGVRGGKPLLRRRTRNILLILTLLIALQALVYQVVNGRANALLSLLSSNSSAGVVVGVDQRPATDLQASSAFPLITTGATAIALSSDDKRLAVAGGDGQHAVAVWDISAQKVVTSFVWSDADLPTTLAWSADGSRLAAANGVRIVIWDLTAKATLWQLGIPSAPAMRVYDVTQQTIVGRPDPATAFNSGALVWGADGTLTSAPGGALGPVGVSTPQAPVVGLWSSSGSHVFAGKGGAALVGASVTDLKRGVALLDWSPGGRYLLWGALSQPIAVGSAATSKTASHVPDSVVGQLASEIGQAGGNAESLVWFAPVGKRVAICDQRTAGAHIMIVDIASGHPVYQLKDTCDGLSAHSASWTGAGTSFYVIPSKGPVQVYTIPAA
ncbi:MAG TPA: zf-HC2 domain-containing protein [Ktedonobacterales bacterium]|nr:zf-HC2 domain-containing protein [Ktedonobacterales bacterium]